MHTIQVGSISIGKKHKLVLIAGPCVIESEDLVLRTAEQVKKITEKLIKVLKDKGLNVVTELEKAGTFWKAEHYHQDYYQKNGKAPYCHRRVKRF